MEAISLEGDVQPSIVAYCERFLEFIIDLEALLPTRRFFNTVLDDTHLLVRAQICNLVQREDGKLFGQVSECFIVDDYSIAQCFYQVQSNSLEMNLYLK